MAQQDHSIVTAARAALIANPNDKNAEFTVMLWDASKSLHNKNIALQAQVDSMKEEVENAEAEVRLANSRNDMLETRLAMSGGGSGCKPAFDASSWFQSQLAIVNAESTAE